jgi:hypothetical protein
MAFLSISYLLIEKDVPHGAIAEEIECFGVYAFGVGGSYVFYGPDTPQAESALNGVAVNLLHQRRPPSADFETWYLEDDPAEQYGWPTKQLPSFKQTDDYPWVEAFGRLEVRGALFNKDLYSIGRLLLTRKASPGAIVSAFENQGMFGFDDFGRLQRFNKSSDQAVAILSALANYASKSRTGVSVDVHDLDRPVYSNYGWPRDLLPNFVAIEAQILEQVRAPILLATSATLPMSTTPQVATSEEGLLTKERNSYNGIIAGLLTFISGELGCSKHPDFDTNSQTKLINHLSKQLKDVLPGNSVSNLKAKFAEANKLRPQIGLPPLKPEAIKPDSEV